MTKADSTVREGRTEELEAALLEMCQDRCVRTCVALTPAGALRPTRAVCRDDEDTEYEVEGPFVLGEPSQETCDSLCKSTPAYEAHLEAGFQEVEIVVACQWDVTGTLDDHAVDCQIGTDCSAGRRPSGSKPCTARLASARDHWAAMATLEQASVSAFRELAVTLLHHGAPASLVERAMGAADDEVRHAEACRKLAGLPLGAAAPPTAHAPLALLELARLNAREGCVLESFAAIQVAWQARHVADESTAAALATIALDEARHAELAWDIDAWLTTQLSAADRAEMDSARVAALADLPRYDAAPVWFAEVGLRRLHDLRARSRAFAAEVGAA